MADDERKEVVDLLALMSVPFPCAGCGKVAGVTVVGKIKLCFDCLKMAGLKLRVAEAMYDNLQKNLADDDKKFWNRR